MPDDGVVDLQNGLPAEGVVSKETSLRNREKLTLYVEHLAVYPPPAFELFVRTALDDPTSVENQDLHCSPCLSSFT